MIYVQYCVIWYDMPSLSHWTNPSWPWNADLLQSSVCTNLCSSQSLAKWLTLKALDFGEQVSFSCTTSYDIQMHPKMMIFGSTAHPTVCDPWTEDKTGTIWVTLGFAPFVISLGWYQLLWWFPEIRTKWLAEWTLNEYFIFYTLPELSLQISVVQFQLCTMLPACVDDCLQTMRPIARWLGLWAAKYSHDSQVILQSVSVSAPKHHSASHTGSPM